MADKQSAPPVWRTLASFLLLAGGVALVALSFIWPGEATSRANWSPEQAKAFSAARAKLHSASNETIRAAGSNNQKSARDKLDVAKAEFDSLRDQLESAIARPKHIALALRIAGFLLAAIGASLIYYKSANH